MSPVATSHYKAPPQPAPRQNPLLGITFKIVAVLTLLAMAALVKTMRDVPVGQIIFFRSACAVIPIVIVLAWQKQLRDGLKTNNLPGHIIRGVVGVSAMVCIFLALRFLPLPDATALQYAVPLMITVLSVLILKENVRLFRWTAVMVGFAGVLIIIWPNLSITTGLSVADTRTLGVAVALFGAMLSAIAQITVSTLTRTESSATIVLYFSITASAAALLTLPFGWIWPSPAELSVLVLIGVLGGAGQMLMTQSYRLADMSIVAPFEYSSLIFSILVGYFVFAEVPTPYMIIGGLIVTAAGIAIIWRERYLAVKRHQIALEHAKPD